MTPSGAINARPAPPPWERAGVRAGLFVGSIASPTICVDGQRMDPIMAALVRFARRMPEPLCAIPDLRPNYVRGVRMTSLRPMPSVVVRDLVVPGGAGDLPARQYTPPAPRGTLLYFHGGGFVMGDLDTHDGLCGTLAARTDLVVVSVAYRLAPEHPFPAAPDDAAAALEWAAQHALRPLTVGGDSAGAQLATIACRDLPTAGVAAQLLFYPVVDMVGEYASAGLFGEGFLLTNRGMAACAAAYIPAGTHRDDARLSPLHAPGLVPAVVVAAGFDPIRDQARAYASALQSAGVAVTLLEESRLVHGFADFAGVVPEARRAVHRAAAAFAARMEVMG